MGKRLAWRVSECVEVQVRAGVEAGAMLKPELDNEPVNSASRCARSRAMVLWTLSRCCWQRSPTVFPRRPFEKPDILGSCS